MLLFKALFHMGRHRAEHTSRRSDTHLCQPAVQILLELFLDLTDRLADLPDVMNLSVQHGARLMLLETLCQNMKSVAAEIADRSHNASGSDIQSEYKLSLSFSYSRHVKASSFLSICLKLSASSPLLSITKSHCLRNSSSESCFDITLSIRSLS